MCFVQMFFLLFLWKDRESPYDDWPPSCLIMENGPREENVI